MRYRTTYEFSGADLAVQSILTAINLTIILLLWGEHTTFMALMVITGLLNGMIRISAKE
jgi:hypothetical protein